MARQQAIPVRLASVTTAQRNALTPGNGDIVYSSTNGRVEHYESAVWEPAGVKTPHSRIMARQMFR